MLRPYRSTCPVHPNRAAAIKILSSFAFSIFALLTVACAGDANPREGLSNMSIKRCDPSRQLTSDQDIKDALTHNLFSFIDNSITVDRPVERFGEDGSYKIMSARITDQTNGRYTIVDGIITISCPKIYFNLPVRRILLKGQGGKVLFCDSETGIQLPLAAISR